MTFDPSITDFYWHDSTLLSLHVDRRFSEKRDDVELWVQSFEDDSIHIFTFHDCYAVDARMNFGVAGTDDIDNLDVISENDPDLIEVINTWRAMNIDLADLRGIHLETISTGSSVKIFSKSWSSRHANSEESDWALGRRDS